MIQFYSLLNKLTMNKIFNNKICITFIIPFVIWTILHWIIPRLYITFCTPNNFYGYLQSLFLTSSPHCNLLRNSLILSSYNIYYLQISFAYFILDILHKNFQIQKVKVTEV